MKQRKGKEYIRGALSASDLAEFEKLGIKSFADEYARLRKLTRNDDFSSNTAAHALIRAQLAAAIRAIGVMDEAFIESGGRNAYSYVAVHGLARELAQDLRSLGDQTESIDRIRRGVIQPMLSGLASAIISDLIKHKQLLNRTLPEKSSKPVAAAFKQIQDGLATLFEDVEAEAAENLRSIITS